VARQLPKPQSEPAAQPAKQRLRAVAGYFADAEAGNADRLIYERVRLGIMSALSVNRSMAFAELKELLNTSDGNLSVHARKLEDAGAAAIVLRSLFEEQITLEQVATFAHTETHRNSFGEALSFFPSPDSFALGPDAYLNQIRRIKEAVRVPVIASLNGASPGGWLAYAQLMEQAGADALELNIYYIPADMDLTGGEVEQTYVDILKAVKSKVKIPVAVKPLLQSAMVDHPMLAKLVAMREELRLLWTRTNVSAPQLVADLQAWCRNAEESGIAMLQEFSLRLRAVQAIG